MIGSITILLLLVLLVVTWPSWPYSRAWGYVPTGAVAVALTVVLVLAFTGYITIVNPWTGDTR